MKYRFRFIISFAFDMLSKVKYMFSFYNNFPKDITIIIPRSMYYTKNYKIIYPPTSLLNSGQGKTKAGVALSLCPNRYTYQR